MKFLDQNFNLKILSEISEPVTEKILTDEDGNEIDLEDDANIIICQQSGLNQLLTLKKTLLEKVL